MSNRSKNILLILAGIIIVGGGLFYYHKTSKANVWEIKMEDDSLRITVPEKLLTPPQH